MSSAAPMQHAKADTSVKTAEHTSQLNAQSQAISTTEFTDQRPQASAQRQLQGAANQSLQSHQFKAFQHMAQHNVRAAQLKNIGAMMHAPAPQRVEDEDALQAKAIASPIQREANTEATQTPKPNNTGLPDNLKSGIESLSGMSMDHVKVHYNSAQPAQLNAHAYAQGSEIHVAPGQEQHLPHEAWHVVQQAQGRVQPTMQMKSGVAVNDNAGLEHEADAMGAKAVSVGVVQGKSIKYGATDASTRNQFDITDSGGQTIGQRKQIKSVENRQNYVIQRITRTSQSNHQTVQLGRDQHRGGNKHTLRSNHTKHHVDRSQQEQRGRRPPKKSKRGHERAQERQRGKANSDGITLKWYHYFLLLLLATSLIPKVNAVSTPRRRSPQLSDGDQDKVLLSFGSYNFSVNNTCSTNDLMNMLTPVSPFTQMSLAPSSPVYSELKHVTCAPEVQEMCTTARSNHAYDEIIKLVDSTCLNVTISPPKQDVGECRYSDTKGEERTGDLSCDTKGGYKPSQVGHELEHAKDSCKMQKNMGVGLSRKVGGLQSEINAHTRQAAIAKIQILKGESVSSRDRDLVASFDLGNPIPTTTEGMGVQNNLYRIMYSYHSLYTGVELSLVELEKTYGKKIQKANSEYQTMIKSP